jgi:glycosyltransferase involved in cell wall biosynthesis
LHRTLIERGPFQAVHSHVHYCSGLVLRIAWRAGVPIRIAHAHTTEDSCFGSPLRLAYRFLMRQWILRHATDLLCTARASGNALFGDACRADPRVRVVPNAIDLAAYEGLDAARQPMRSELGVGPAALLVGHVGRFHRAKNHRFLIDLFAALRRWQDAELVLVGDGPLRGEIERRVLACGLGRHVRFLGVREDVPKIMAALDVFVFPSLYEGFGMVVIEAQAAGVPCLVATGIPEEADAGLDLVRRLPLEVGPIGWADAVSQCARARCGDCRDHARIVRAGGYGIERLAQALEGVYGIA